MFRPVWQIAASRVAIMLHGLQFGASSCFRLVRGGSEVFLGVFRAKSRDTGCIM